MASPHTLAELDPRVRPLTLAAERALPVLDALRGLLPAGLPRGATLAVSGSAGRSFALALVGAATQAGSWVAVAGLPGFGWRAAGELGVDLARVVVVEPLPPASVAGCLAALVDGFDAVVLGAGAVVSAATARRLAARARERGSVVLAVAEAGGAGQRLAIDNPDLRASVEGQGWEGVGAGQGHLQGRRVDVHLEGRRLPGRRRRDELWLPDRHGRVAAVAPSIPRIALAAGQPA